MVLAPPSAVRIQATPWELALSQHVAGGASSDEHVGPVALVRCLLEHDVPVPHVAVLPGCAARRSRWACNPPDARARVRAGGRRNLPSLRVRCRARFRANLGSCAPLQCDMILVAISPQLECVMTALLTPDRSIADRIPDRSIADRMAPPSEQIPSGRLRGSPSDSAFYGFILPVSR